MTPNKYIIIPAIAIMCIMHETSSQAQLEINLFGKPDNHRTIQPGNTTSTYSFAKESFVFTSPELQDHTERPDQLELWMIEPSFGLHSVRSRKALIKKLVPKKKIQLLNGPPIICTDILTMESFSEKREIVRLNRLPGMELSGNPGFYEIGKIALPGIYYHTR